MSIIDHVASLLDSEDVKYTREDNVLMMRWKTDHFELHGEIRHVTCVAWWENGKLVSRHQLQTAVAVPPPGPGHGQAIAALKHIVNDLRNQSPPPDASDIDDALNAGDE